MFVVSNTTSRNLLCRARPLSCVLQLLSACYGIQSVVQEEAVVSKLKVRRKVGTALCAVTCERVAQCCGWWLWSVIEARKSGRRKDKSFAPSFYLQVKVLLHSPAFPSLWLLIFVFAFTVTEQSFSPLEANTWPRVITAHSWKVICASELWCLIWPAIKLKMHVKHVPRITWRSINYITIFCWWALWLFAYFTLMPDLHWCFLGHPESFP